MSILDQTGLVLGCYADLIVATVKHIPDTSPPDLIKWLGMVWEALPEEDLAKRKEMLQDANSVLEQLRPQVLSASEHPD